MILKLDLRVKNVKFELAIKDALKYPNNVFIRRPNWGKSLYACIKKGDNDNNETMIKLVNINENCDMFTIANWDTQISIDNAIANDWSVYMATLV